MVDAVSGVRIGAAVGQAVSRPMAVGATTVVNPRGQPFLTLPSGSDFVAINVTSGTITVTIAGHPVAAYNGEYTIDAADVTGDDSTIYGGPGFYVLRDGLGDPIGPVVYGETTDPADISRAHMVVLVDPAVYATAGRTPVLTGVWELDGAEMSGGDVATRADAGAGVYTFVSSLTLPTGDPLEIESAGHTVAPAVPWADYPGISHVWDAQISGSIILAPDVQTWEDQVGSLDLVAPATGQQPFFSATNIGSTYPALTTTASADVRTLRGSAAFNIDDFAIITVVKTSTGDTVIGINSSADSGALFFLDQSSDQFRLAARSNLLSTLYTVQGGADPDSYAIVSAYAIGGTMYLRVNGTAIGSADVSTITATYDQFSLFARPDGLAATAVAGIGTVLFAPDNTGVNALDLTDIQALETAVAARYGLSGLLP